ncbi:hypothetical protein CROQUDRAFT_95672 [Cronartium quercuum f. sp. fusiforme G11]|uniref:Uncharacterized protein n=1 Tax=Cronartium quercuum f. sp. fusiforme G11 TaxID=708437 RepID=A0A9P6NC19_9BASI|nr:hypothetical protein CROQUDRAFT_95672 [Cronartium quercuum f. sp. fusiforme G11]
MTSILLQLSSHIEEIVDAHLAAIDSLSPRFEHLIDNRITNLGGEIVDNQIAAIDSLFPHFETLINSQITHTIDTRIEARVDARVDAQVDARLTSRVAQAVDARVSSQLESHLQAHDESSVKDLLPVSIHKLEPPVPHLFFAGQHAHLLTFVHAIKDALNRDPFKAPGLPYVLLIFNTIDEFMDALILEFKDRFVAKNALKDLQALKQHDKKIGEFNSLFISLSSLLSELPESVLIDYYENALNPKVLDQALARADWATTSTLQHRQDIAVLASEQLEAHQGQHQSHPMIHSYPATPQAPLVHVRQDPNAMEIALSYPPANYMPHYLPAPSIPPLPFPGHFQPGLHTAHDAIPPSSSSTVQTLAISSTFLEYRDLNQPTYYDLPGLTYDTDNAKEISEISSITFSNHLDSNIHLILNVTLYAGPCSIKVRALVDPGSEGNFIDNTFATTHKLSLEPRPFPLVWMPWLKSHHGWVGGAGPSLRLEDSSELTIPGKGTYPSVASSSIDPPLDLSFLPKDFHEFADVFNPQNTSKLPPLRPGYDMEINLKSNCIPPTSNSYLLSQDEEAELKAYLEVQLAKGFIRKSSSPIGSPIFFVKSEGKANRPCVDY